MNIMLNLYKFLIVTITFFLIITFQQIHSKSSLKEVIQTLQEKFIQLKNSLTPQINIPLSENEIAYNNILKLIRTKNNLPSLEDAVKALLKVQGFLFNKKLSEERNIKDFSTNLTKEGLFTTELKIEYILITNGIKKKNK